MKKTSFNMTEGNIAKQIVTFAIPLLIGQIFQNLYNSVDMIVVGNVVGTTGLAAVASGGDSTHILVGFFTGLSSGAGIVFSRAFGAKDYQRLHDGIHTAIAFALLLGLALATLGILGVPALLKITDTPDDVYEQAATYMRIYFVGTTFTSIYNVCSGVLRAVGDSKRPFYYLVVSSITNIILDIVLVAGLGMGVAGAALATIGSQCLSVTLIIRQMTKTDDVYKLHIKDLRLHKELLHDILAQGIPAGIQTCLTSFSNLFVTRYINGFGSAAMAGIGAAKKVDRFVGMAGQSLGQATATFVGQNYGAGKMDRAYRGIRVCCLVAAVYMLCAGIPLYINATPVIRLFISDPEPVKIGVAMCHAIMPLYYCQTLNNIFSNAVRGFGKSFVVMCCSIFGMIGCRQIFLAVSMGMNHDVSNIYYAYPVGWFCAALFVILYYFVFIKPKFKNGVPARVHHDKVVAAPSEEQIEAQAEKNNEKN